MEPISISQLGWYFFAFLMLAAVDFPIVLPVGDLSQGIRGYSDRNVIA